MLNQFSRTQLLLGAEAMNVLRNARVAVFGIGGVGGYIVEALVRSGVGTVDLIDDDRICLTNLNRQITATRQTVGRFKTEVMRERAESINPAVKIIEHRTFYLPQEAGSREEDAESFDFSDFDYVADAVDTVTAKLGIICGAKQSGVPVISAMGAGDKLNPAAFRVADISETRVDRLAKVMRRELKKRGIRQVKCVYSEEKPIKPVDDPSISCRVHCVCPPGTKRKCSVRRDIPGSTAFVPPVVGMIMAGEIIKDLTGVRNDGRVV